MGRIFRLVCLVLFPLLGLCWLRGGVAAGSQIPPLRGDAWINSRPLTPEALKGKVVLVDFWEYTCVNCLRTFPYVKAWNARYAKDGLVIIGVHTPEFEFCKKEANVKRAARELGLTYPIVLDNEYHIWRAFHNQYWPRDYLFDATGKLRYDHIGEGDYGRTESEIQELLHEIHPGAVFPKPLQALTAEDTPGAVCYPMTPELYVGYWRGTLGNAQGYQPGKVVDYRDPGAREDGVIYAQGEWLNEKQAMRHARETKGLPDYIAIKYHAIDVNAVIRPEEEKKFKVYVFQDGKPLLQQDAGADIRFGADGKSYLPVREPRMYRVVHNAKFGTHELRLASDSDGFALYSYTFGACMIPPR